MACLRLKRLLEEDPVEAIVVSHKRRCLDRGDEPEEEIKTIFKFVGTVRSKEECVDAHLTKAISQENRTTLNRKRKNECLVDTTKKGKVESPQSCFKLIRNVSEDDEASATLENTVKGLCRLYDAEQYAETTKEVKSKNKESEAITCNGILLQLEDAQPVEYVYDLYYSDVLDHTEEELLQDSIKIEYCGFDSELVHDNEDEEDMIENDEDSNDELNWRNDYPDEDDFENDDEGYDRENDDDISNRMATFGIGNGSYFEDSSGVEVDSEEERQFGRSYAKFRARFKARQKGEEEEDDEEDNEDNDVLNNAKCGNPFAG